MKNSKEIATDPKRLWLSFHVLTAALILDILISKMFPVVNSYLNSWIWIWIFIFLAALIVLSQYIILFFTKSKTLGIGKLTSTMRLSLLNRTIVLIQGIIYAIVGFCIFQMFFGEEYYTNILPIIATISFAVEIFILCLLTLKLLKWYRLNKSKILWMFILSSSSLALTGILMNLQINILFENSLSRVSDDMPGISPALAGNTFIEFLQGSYFIFALVSFTLMWITTAFLLYHHSKKVGNKKYWLVIAIPLVFYLSQFIFLNTETFSVLINANPFFYIIILNTVYSMSLPIGGILFAVAFLMMAKTVGKDNPNVQNYLKLSAYGILLIFVASQTTITRLNFPPFGILSISVVGLASYILFIGMYSSAISASIDKELMRSIRRATIQKTQFLHNIAEAEIISHVLKITKRQEQKWKEEVGIESSLSEEETKDYLEQVILEMKQLKDRER